MTRSLLLVFLLFQFIGERIYAQTGKHVPELVQVDKEVAIFIEEWKIPGASVAIVKNGKLVYARAFGKADEGTAAEPNHLFRIASLSKPVTALAILKLVEHGRLHLEDRVFGNNGILNDREYQYFLDERMEDITIKHLLEHSAGWDRAKNLEGDPMFLPLAIAVALNKPVPANKMDVISYQLTKDLDYSPGTRYAYSNFGYNILGRVIEKISGMSYGSYVREAILRPSGIEEMELGHNFYDQKQPLEVKYYNRPEKKLVASVCRLGEKVAAPYGGFNLEAMDAHGGWLASATCLAKLLVATDGIPGKPDIINPSLLKQMAVPSLHNPYYALGWCVNEVGNRWHTGSLPGTSAIMTQVADGTGWVILLNGNPGTFAYFNQLDRLMWNALNGVVNWPDHDLFLQPTLIDPQLIVHSP